MKKPEFPARTCREPVWNDLMVYPCEIIHMHPGPCASFSARPSVIRRDEWELANPDWEKKIGDLDVLL